MIAWLEKIFKIKENNTTVKREIYTGLITFLAVSYILAVNPAILGSAGMDRGGGCVPLRFPLLSARFAWQFLPIIRCCWLPVWGLMRFLPIL